MTPPPGRSRCKPGRWFEPVGPADGGFSPPQARALDETEAMLADFVDCPPDEEKDPSQPCS